VCGRPSARDTIGKTHEIPSSIETNKNMAKFLDNRINLIYYRLS
jgi:hypothetical protein